MPKFHFVGTCVSLPETLIHYLKHNGEEISYRQMAKLADLSEFRGLGHRSSADERVPDRPGDVSAAGAVDDDGG